MKNLKKIGVMKKLIVGNWKMNGSLEDAKILIADILNTLFGLPETLDKCDFVVCPPFIHIPAIRHAITTVDMVSFGAQDCSVFDEGAYTGEVSAAMLKDSHCQYVIAGHSERREHCGESDEIVAQKVAQVHANDMTAIICVGESAAERDKGEQQDVVAAQLKGGLPDSVNAENTIIAYEPVWAIGSGETPSNDAIQTMHAFIRKHLSEVYSDGGDIKILYGGSVKPDNAAGIFGEKDVDGALIGGASLSAESFIEIAKAV